MIGRPNFQDRVERADDAVYHGATRVSRVLGTVWHATAGDTATGARGWMDRKEKVMEGGKPVFKPLPSNKRSSYTYIIDKSGKIVRTLHPLTIAYHAGNSQWLGLPRLNDSLNHCTLGVSFANDNGSDDNPNDDELTYEQLESGLWLGSVLMETYGYGAEVNLQHREVSPGRKQDVAAHILDPDFWREQLAMRVWPETIYALRP